jgi:glycosyltransferase involved in cell wall biosynthesis
MTNKNHFTVVIPRKHSEVDILGLLKILSADSNVAQVLLIEDNPPSDMSPECLSVVNASQKFEVVRVDEDKGPGQCRNLGIEKATSPYLVFVDADDLVMESYFEKLSTIIADQPDVDVFRFAYHVAKNGEAQYQVNAYAKEFWNTPTRGNQMILPSGKTTLVDYAYVWAGAYKTQFLQENNIRFCETYSAEDFYFFWKLLLANPLVLVNNEAWYLHHKNQGITSSLSEANLTYMDSFRQIVALDELSSNIGYFGKAVRQFLAVSVNHLETCKKNEDLATEARIMDGISLLLESQNRKWVYAVLAGLPRARSMVRQVLDANDFYTRFTPANFLQVTTAD